MTHHCGGFGRLVLDDATEWQHKHQRRKTQILKHQPPAQSVEMRSRISLVNGYECSDTTKKNGKIIFYCTFFELRVFSSRERDPAPSPRNSTPH